MSWRCRTAIHILERKKAGRNRIRHEGWSAEESYDALGSFEDGHQLGLPLGDPGGMFPGDDDQGK